MHNQIPVLLVEDDEPFAALLAEEFAVGTGFSIAVAASIAEAEACLGAPDSRFEALLLDIDLPDGDGRELCARLRREGCPLPVILLTGSDREADIVRGLELGANDYVVKPCSTAELLARLRAQLRGYENRFDAVLSIGPFTFRPSKRLLHDPTRNRRTWLTEKEVELIKSLHRARGEAVAREVLLDEVWGYNAAVASHTLETHIYRLRRKIEADPYNPQLLLSAAGGYRLAAA